jgi:hypothetical protein
MTDVEEAILPATVRRYDGSARRSDRVEFRPISADSQRSRSAPPFGERDEAITGLADSITIKRRTGIRMNYSMK